MLSDSQRERLAVLLVSPRNPLNIGATARAMANFGFSRLAVVAPYEPHWREARSAMGAEKLLQKARCTASLPEAIAGCTLVAGTGSLARRKPEQPVVPLPILVPVIQHEIARGGRAALVFGPEKRGLTRDDLSLCHVLVEIPTQPRQPSMNLGQAVAVCLYELSAPRSQSSPPIGNGSAAGWAESGNPLARPGGDFDSGLAEPSATAADLDLLTNVVESTLAAANYSPAAMRNANRHDLQALLRRLALSRRDAVRILGAFRRILWSLRHRNRGD